VNWRQLMGALPSAVAGMTLDGEPRGETSGYGGMSVSQASVRFRGPDDRRVEFEVLDTALAQMMVAPFHLARMVTQDSSTEVQRPVQLGPHPGFVRYGIRERRGELDLLVSGRFLVKIEGQNVGSADDLEPLALPVFLARLAELAPNPTAVTP
jgi:hypothetical protein